VATQTYETLSKEFTQIFRRQQDNLPAHITKDIYFEDQGPGHPDTGYFFDTTHRKRPIEFIQVNDSYHWVRLRRNQDTWETNLSGIYNGPEVGWWLIIDPQHPNYIFRKQEASVSTSLLAMHRPRHRGLTSSPPLMAHSKETLLLYLLETGIQAGSL